MVPAAAAVNRPLPTRPAKAGSCPEPPPETMDTLGEEEDDDASGRRKMILFSRSKAREGFVRVRECRAVRTRLSGSEKKCFAW